MLAMIDSGADFKLGPPRLAMDLGNQLVPHNDSRCIGTAHTESKLVISGWIFPVGFTGPILISTVQLQRHGVGVYRPPHVMRLSAY